MTVMNKTIDSETLRHLQQGHLIITASNRQADYLHQAYREQQSESVWYRANIITWNDWVKDSVERLQMLCPVNAPLLLTKNQCLYLWQKEIEASGDPLLNVPLASKKVYRAAEILNDWLQADELADNQEFEHRLETRQFRDWYLSLSLYLEDKNLIAPYQLQQQLLNLLGQGTGHLLSMKSQVRLIGFQQMTPVQEHIIAQLKDCGIQFSTMNKSAQTAEQTRLEFKDILTELQQTAIWAKGHFDQEPTQRLAIIVPELEQYRELIRRSFSKVFQSDYWLDPSHEPTRPFDISLALPLTDYPMIQDLLMLLALKHDSIAQHEMIHLIQSRYLGQITQSYNTTPFIRQVKESRVARVKLNSLESIILPALNESQQHEMAGIIELFNSLSELDTSSKRTASEWVSYVTHWLLDISYADESGLSSDEYQTKEALYKVLASVASFDVITQEMSWSEWFSLLKQQLYSRLFQPQTGHCPIQIMGLFEAQSIPFDYVRMVGVDNQLWPAKANPNPFLPYPMQKQLNMPSANPERELKLCLEQYESLISLCKEIIFSHVNDTTEANAGVSPVIEHLSRTQIEGAVSVNTQQEDLFSLGHSLEWNILDDTYGTPYENDRLKGGSYLLKEMAACPFRAFVHHRLSAQDPHEPLTDFDGMDKGKLVHSLLEIIWRDLLENSFHNLVSRLDTEAFQSQLDDLIWQTIEQLNAEKNHLLIREARLIEHKRLKRLINQWLQTELKREPFTVIAGEQSYYYSIAGMTIKLTVDRIDELESGESIIIDYKTGRTDLKEWFGNRPTEPQMPLYGCILDKEGADISAIVYGMVRYQECKFSGISEQPKSLPGLRHVFAKTKYDTEAETIHEQVPIWQTELTELVSGYASGLAEINPKDSKTCNYCDLQGVCRIADINERNELAPNKGYEQSAQMEDNT